MDLTHVQVTVSGDDLVFNDYRQSYDGGKLLPWQIRAMSKRAFIEMLSKVSNTDVGKEIDSEATHKLFGSFEGKKKAGRPNPTDVERCGMTYICTDKDVDYYINDHTTERGKVYGIWVWSNTCRRDISLTLADISSCASLLQEGKQS